MEAIPIELYPTYTALMLTIEEWGDAIFAHFDRDRVTGAFVEGANGLARVLSRMGRGYGLKALRARCSMDCARIALANGPRPKNREMAAALMGHSSGYLSHEFRLKSHL